MASARAVVCALFFAQVVSALSWKRGWGLDKRADSNVFVPAPVQIPLHFDSAGRYVTTVTMAPGSNPQRFNFTMSTTSGLTYVASSQCSDCSGANFYNQAQSSSAVQLSAANSAPLFGQNAAASVIKENCDLTQSNGSAWSYPNQTIVVVNTAAGGQVAQLSNAQVGHGLSGLIGLGTNRNTPPSGNSSVYTPQFQDSIYGEWLHQNPTALNFSFGMALATPLNTPRGNNSFNLDTSGSAGQLNWLQPDSNAYDASKAVFKNVSDATTGQLPVSANSTSGGDWFVGLDGWLVISGNNQIQNTESVVATVDPLYSDLYLPQSEARLIHDSIPGSQLRTDLSSLGPLSEAWAIPCNSTFSFGLIVGSQTFTVDQSTLVIKQPDGTCISGIEAWTDASQTQYLIGARFLSTLYLIFQIPQNGPNSIGFAPRAVVSKSSSHVGAIVGGVIGGVAFLILLGFLIFFFIYRHRNQAYRITAAQYEGAEIEKPTHGTIHPFPTTPTAVQFAHAESTVGSSTVSPMSPSRSHIAMMNDDHDMMDIAPPSYDEASERNRSPTTPVHVRPEKPARHSRLSSASSSQTSPIPLTPISPTNATQGTGSATIWE